MIRWPSLVFLSSSMLVALPCFADSLDHRLIGAWLTSASDCAKVFEKRGGRINLRQPIDQFATAFIIGPSEIVASGGRCRIGKVSNAANVTTLSLDCNNTVGYAQQTSRITILGDAKIQYDASGESLLGVNYEKCPF